MIMELSAIATETCWREKCD